MKIEIPVKDAKFSMTKGELNYYEVIDDFENAEYIDIVTYNISQFSNILLDRLKKVRQGIRVNIITNIPSRWDEYWKNEHRIKALKSIELYTSRLNPQKYPCLLNSMFAFDNHGKIILTNNVVYWGSANFSDESENNIEFGTITRDKEFIQRIHDEIVYIIKSNADPYYASPNASKYYELIMMKNDMLRLQCDYETFIYDYYDYPHYEKKVFKDHIVGLGADFMKTYIAVLNNIEGLCHELYVIISEIHDDVFSNSYYGRYEMLVDRINMIFRLFDNQKVSNIVDYSPSDVACDILQERYYREAYDEYLDHYAMKANDEAYDRLAQLTIDAKDILIDLENIMNELNHCIQEIVEMTRQSKLLEINCSINNAKQ